MPRSPIAFALAAVVAFTAACGSDPETSPTTPAPTASTIARWLNQPCDPEGTTAVTPSGGELICEQVGSDTVPQWHAVGDPTTQAQPEPSETELSETEPSETELSETEPSETEEDVYYQNCTAVRAAGADPIRRGDPGYSRKLDRDGDGTACE